MHGKLSTGMVKNIDIPESGKVYVLLNGACYTSIPYSTSHWTIVLLSIGGGTWVEVSNPAICKVLLKYLG